MDTNESNCWAFDKNGNMLRLGDVVMLDKMRTGRKFHKDKKVTGVIEEMRFSSSSEPIIKAQSRLFNARDVEKVLVTDAQAFIVREFKIRGAEISLDAVNAIIAAARLPETYPDYDPFTEFEGEGNVAREGED